MQPNWISTQRENPEDETTVLIHDPGADEPVSLGYKDGRIWRDMHGECRAVAHWMHLPEPPAGLPQQSIS